MSFRSVEAYYLGNHKHAVQVTKESKELTYSLYRIHPNATEWILDSSEETIEFESQYEPIALIKFLVKFSDGETLNFGHRILSIAGMYNFRDLGGYPTVEGLHVKWGLLFRGDHLNNLKPEGQAFLDSLNLKSIIDLRSEREIQEHPNLGVASDTQQYVFPPDGTIAVYSGSLQNDEGQFKHENFLETAKEMIKRDKNAAIHSMIDQQIQFVNNEKSKEAFAQTIRLLAKENSSPSFVHCKGGKDRTGFAALLILGLLGVSEDQIRYDYMLTKKAREKKNQMYYERFLKMSNDPEVADFMFSIFDTQEVFIQSALNEIKREYGTIGSYARYGLGITDDEINQMRRMYLE